MIEFIETKGKIVYIKRKSCTIILDKYTYDDLIKNKNKVYSTNSAFKKQVFVQLDKEQKRRHIEYYILGIEGLTYRVFHKNGDPFDCRRENLEWKDRQACHSTGKEYKGVYPTEHGTYQVRVYGKGRRSLNIGNYDNKELAAKKADATYRYMGFDVFLNFPQYSVELTEWEKLKVDKFKNGGSK